MTASAFDLGFGPMSPEIVAALAEWTIQRDRPLMLIASRSQVDTSEVGGGYVMDTSELGTLTRNLNAPKLQLCRDHCGPFLSKRDEGLSLEDALERCKMTIAADLAAGFGLIHIDASQCGEHEREVASELIDFVLNQEQSVEFEYGSEDNIGVAVSAQKYEEDLRFVCELIQPRFVVGQTGSLVRQARQAGTFDVEHARALAAMAETFGTRLKEHNADYLERDEIDLRRKAGVHALNIAPQLGVAQTVTTAFAAHSLGLHDEWDDFRDVVLQGGNWSKWGARTLTEMVATGGHYHFNSPEYQALLDKLSRECDIRGGIRDAIWQIVDRYAD